MPQIQTGKILTNVFHALKYLRNIDEIDVCLIALYTTSYILKEINDFFPLKII